MVGVLRPNNLSYKEMEGEESGEGVDDDDHDFFFFFMRLVENQATEDPWQQHCLVANCGICLKNISPVFLKC
jgi:hypothetical protein